MVVQREIRAAAGRAATAGMRPLKWGVPAVSLVKDRSRQAPTREGAPEPWISSGELAFVTACS